MNIFFNPLDSKCKSIRGAIKQNQQLIIRIYPKDDEIYECYLQLRLDSDANAKGYPLIKSGDSFFVCLEIEKPGLYWYFFTINGSMYGRNNLLELSAESYRSYQLTVVEKDYTAPEFLKGGLIYQIFPDRFNKVGDFSVGEGKVKRYDWGGLPTYRNADGKVLNNEFFGGSFNGIKEKLPYLKSLGVTAIYLNPISKAYSSHRYDTGDYLEVDSVLGTYDDLKSLVACGKQMGIAFIFDGVFNHTGADSRYFNRYGNYDSVGAYNSEQSEYKNWYSFLHYPDKYDSWWGFESLPSIKKNSQEFQAFITEKVLPFYYEAGFSGVRLDVVDELSGEFVEKIRKKSRELCSDSAVIGEVWEDATYKIAYGERKQYFIGKQLDSIMNYPLKDAIIGYLLSADAKKLEIVVKEQLNNYSSECLAVLMNCLSTHDTPRIITVLGRERVITDKDEMAFEKLSNQSYKHGKELVKLAYALVFTLYGVPSVYYGDEIGMSGNLDPYNRKCFVYDRADIDLVDFIKKLSEIRKDETFKYGETDIIYVDKGIFIFERTYQDSQYIIAVNRFTEPRWLDFSYEVEELIYGNFIGKRYSLNNNSVAIFKRKKD